MRLVCLILYWCWSGDLLAQELGDTEVIPLPDNQASFQSKGIEKFRWHFDTKYPRPFFYPFNGPSGSCLTRIGHPGAPNHDHHLSVWFAHHKVNGHNFWANTEGTSIRQKQWLAYQDGENEAIMASLIGWYSAEGVEQMEQELIVALRPSDGGEYELELQSTFHPPESVAEINLEKTNFGFLAVRVAKSISEYFGNGILTNSEGQVHEKDIFGRSARWMDYSGPVAIGEGESRKRVVEGITMFDHPDNPRYPTHWHVREDGWMGASFCMQEGFVISKGRPLTLRYLLHSHSGKYDHNAAETVAAGFSRRPRFELISRPRKHTFWGVRRVDSGN